MNNTEPNWTDTKGVYVSDEPPKPSMTDDERMKQFLRDNLELTVEVVSSDLFHVGLGFKGEEETFTGGYIKIPYGLGD